MQRILKVLTSLLIAAAVSTACNKKDEESYTQQLTINNKDYSLHKAMMINYGTNDAVYSGSKMSMNLVSSGVDFDINENDEIENVTGDGYVIYFQVYTEGEEEVLNGTYTYGHSLKIGSMDIAEITVVKNGKDEDYIALNKGSITMRKIGDQYGLKGSLITSDGGEVKLSFKGDFIKFDER